MNATALKYEKKNKIPNKNEYRVWIKPRNIENRKYMPGEYMNIDKIKYRVIKVELDKDQYLFTLKKVEKQGKKFSIFIMETKPKKPVRIMNSFEYSNSTIIIENHQYKESKFQFLMDNIVYKFRTTPEETKVWLARSEDL